MGPTQKEEQVPGARHSPGVGRTERFPAVLWDGCGQTHDGHGCFWEEGPHWPEPLWGGVSLSSKPARDGHLKANSVVLLVTFLD